MHLRSVFAVYLSSTVLLLANAPARAENVQSAPGNPESCQERVNDQNFREVIAGCTAIIDGGNASRADLGRAHYIRGRGYRRADEDLKAAADLTGKDSSSFL